MTNLRVDLTGQVAVLTGGAGVLGMAMAHALSASGARGALLSRTKSKLETACQELTETSGNETMALACDVTDEGSLREALEQLKNTWGRPHILINAAGGNRAGATVMPDADIFKTTPADWRGVIDLNMAAIDNFTGWLASELATRYAGKLRVNAIAPGFFIADQNRALLLNEDGTPTKRGGQVLERTPMGRFGEPEELQGALLYLVSDAASFVTGTVLKVDGGKFGRWTSWRWTRPIFGCGP